MDVLNTELLNLTQYEHFGLSSRHNMADGHAHQTQSQAQMRIVNRLPQIWQTAERDCQSDLEREFKTVFFKLAGQSYSPDADYSHLSYSASISIEVVANYLKRHGMATALINPTFDNIASIMRRVGVPLIPIEEDRLADEPLSALLEEIEAPAVFLVCPNNPTGLYLDRDEFEMVVRFCQRTGKLLILDCSFRFFSDYVGWDQYRLLHDSGIDFITIEDTGKTWPTLDLKVGMLSSNARLYDDLFVIHNDILLNVSPLILRILIEYISDSLTNGLESTIMSVVRTNRQTIREAVRGTYLTPVTNTDLSVEWLRIENPEISGTELWNHLSSCGVYVLPGTYFYWNQPERGNRFIRVALMRPIEQFRQSALALRQAVLD